MTAPPLPLQVTDLVRPAVRELPVYTPSKDATVDLATAVRLDMNESPYGPSPQTRALLAEFTETHRYPDFAQAELREALSRYTGVPADRIVPGAGLDDVFMTLGHLIIDRGDEVIISEPTFGMYRPLFSLLGGVVVDAPLTESFDLDVERVLAAVSEPTKLVVICSPNNPTGNLLDPAAVERICAEAPCLVAVDEAYAEFAGTSSIQLMSRYDNLVVLRTMSKWAGLAGMRIGYGLMPEALAPLLPAVAPGFYNVSLIAARAAIASLEDADYLRGIVARIVADRDTLAEQLRDLPGVEPLPSVTNFLLVRLPVEDAGPVVKRLAELGVLVRSFGHRALRDCLRVTVGTPADHDRFLAALETALKEAES
jgi:histidinol-phosphate aminotransferase